MKLISLFSAVFLVSIAAFGGDVPPVTASDFAGEPVHPIWMILAGQGPIGAILVAALGWLYAAFRPAIKAWVESKKLEKLYLAAESAVSNIQATYVEGMKRANADGKLTSDETLFVFAQCKSQFIDIMRTQGIDIIREYGDTMVSGLIEIVVSRLNAPAVVKAVAAPLSASAQPPLPEL